MTDSKASDKKRDGRLGCDMLQALYDFEATLAKTLSFQEKEMFVLYPANKKQRQWWQVVNRKAQVGFIPSNYVTTLVLNTPTGGWRRKNNHYVEGGDFGNREDKISELLRKMV